MNLSLRTAACLFLVCAACHRDASVPGAAAAATDPVAPGTPLRFTGEVVLTGRLARASTGAVVILVRPVGGKDASWRRSYEVADPWWTQTASGRSLPFGLSPDDALVDPAPPLSAEMEIVARYDPDGNPDTLDTDAVEVATRARTGATDLVLTLGHPTGLKTGPDISRTEH